jgi:nucleoside-diphosphate-sugar epimerase
MTVLVTGGTGFLGSHLIAALLQRGESIRALVRSPAKATALGFSGVEWIEGTLTDDATLRRATEGVDVVYHLAGLTAARSEAEYLATNRDGTSRLLRATETDTRFVLVSSLAAAGPSQRGAPLTGSEPALPVSAYGRSKLAAETVVRDSDRPWVILRPPAVYGPRDREMFRLFRAVTLGIAPVFGDGSQELSLVFGPDLAEAVIRAGTIEGIEGRTYYPAHPEILSSRMVVETLGTAAERRARVVGIPIGLARPLLHVTGAVARLVDRATLLNPDKGNEFFATAWTCDPSAFGRDSGWQADHGLLAGATKTFAWYRKTGWL